MGSTSFNMNSHLKIITLDAFPPGMRVGDFVGDFVRITDEFHFPFCARNNGNLSMIPNMEL